MKLRTSNKVSSTKNPDDITGIEFAVLLSTCEGLSNSEIGREIRKSNRTVVKYRNDLCQKLHVRDKKELIEVASKLFKL